MLRAAERPGVSEHSEQQPAIGQAGERPGVLRAAERPGVLEHSEQQPAIGQTGERPGVLRATERPGVVVEHYEQQPATGHRRARSFRLPAASGDDGPMIGVSSQPRPPQGRSTEPRSSRLGASRSGPSQPRLAESRSAGPRSSRTGTSRTGTSRTRQPDTGRAGDSPIPRSRRVVVGAVAAAALVAALTAAMLPIRPHLNVATAALVLVVPVVVGVALGGFGAGVVATATGFLAYALVFIPPYYTLSVGGAQNWAALGVYAVVMVVAARVVARAASARADAQRRADELRRLFDLSELLVRDASLPELLLTVVSSVRDAFDLDGAALLLPSAGRLQLAASAGEPLTADELRHLSSSGLPVSLDSAAAGRDGLQVLVLATTGEPIGLLALRGLTGTSRDHELLHAFANHLALALERAELREQALRAQLLEEVDRLRRSLVGAVSHDLRSPLATVLVAVSALRDPDAPVSSAAAAELLGLIDLQAHRLDRLVANLLDMTRIQSGALELRRWPTTVDALVQEALAVLGPADDVDRVRWEAPALPAVDVDRVLVGQVLVNLLDNALRYSPAESPVTVSAVRRGRDRVVLSVEDRGPGVSPDERPHVFHMFNRREAGGRGGLGLAIAHAFVEAHGQRIWVEDHDGGGARFCFTLPVATAAAGGAVALDPPDGGAVAGGVVAGGAVALGPPAGDQPVADGPAEPAAAAFPASPARWVPARGR